MFCATVRNTVKTLLRAKSFWLAVLVFAALVFWDVKATMIGEDITFELPVPILYSLAQMVHNQVITVMYYAFPVFAVITVALVLEQDYDNQFFEVEKAMDVRPSMYLAGRICALAAVDLTTVAVFTFLRQNINVYLMGGFRGMPLGKYLLESTYDLLRMDLLFCLPSLLYYIGIVYLIGSLLRSGKAAAIGGFAHVIAFYFYRSRFRWQATPNYFDYFSPIPDHLHHFASYAGVEGAEKTLQMFDTKVSDVLICLSFLLGVFALGMLLSYFTIRRRET